MPRLRALRVRLLGLVTRYVDRLFADVCRRFALRSPLLIYGCLTGYLRCVDLVVPVVTGWLLRSSSTPRTRLVTFTFPVTFTWFVTHIYYLPFVRSGWVTVVGYVYAGLVTLRLRLHCPGYVGYVLVTHGWLVTVTVTLVGLFTLHVDWFVVTLHLRLPFDLRLFGCYVWLRYVAVYYVPVARSARCSRYVYVRVYVTLLVCVTVTLHVYRLLRLRFVDLRLPARYVAFVTFTLRLLR